MVETIFESQTPQSAQYLVPTLKTTIGLLCLHAVSSIEFVFECFVNVLSEGSRKKNYGSHEDRVANVV